MSFNIEDLVKTEINVSINTDKRSPGQEKKILIEIRTDIFRNFQGARAFLTTEEAEDLAERIMGSAAYLRKTLV